MEVACAGRELTRVESGAPDILGLEVLEAFEAAIEWCMEPQHLERFAESMHHAAEIEFNYEWLATLVQAYPVEDRTCVQELIRGCFEAQSNRSVYGLINTVTVLARDIQNEQMKWRPEEMGGMIPALLPLLAGAGPEHAVAEVPQETWPVG
jgi:hypothetical protein